MIDDPGTEASFRDMLRAICLSKEQRLPTPYFQDESVTLYNADAKDILPLLAPVGAIVTDPPYGISYNPRGWQKWNGDPSEFSAVIGDDKPFDPRFLLHFPAVILWGANHFLPCLPFGDLLIWDKRGSEKLDRMFGDSCEVAWRKSNSGKSHVYIARIQHGGVVNADASTGNNAPRFHPTQKPVSLMRWCIEQVQEEHVILDPFSGSGTTLLAAKQLGRKSIGIEISPEYCALTVERLRQSVLPFTPQPAPVPPEQQPLFSA